MMFKKRRTNEPPLHHTIFVGVFNEANSPIITEHGLVALIEVGGQSIFLKDQEAPGRKDVFINPHIEGSEALIAKSLTKAQTIVYVDNNSNMSAEIKAFHDKHQLAGRMELAGNIAYSDTRDKGAFDPSKIEVVDVQGVLRVGARIASAVKDTLRNNNAVLTDLEKILVNTRLNDLITKRDSGVDSPRQQSVRDQKIQAVEYVLYNPRGDASAVELIKQAKQRFPKATSGARTHKVRDLFNDIEKAHKADAKAGRGGPD